MLDQEVAVGAQVCSRGWAGCLSDGQQELERCACIRDSSGQSRKKLSPPRRIARQQALQSVFGRGVLGDLAQRRQHMLQHLRGGFEERVGIGERRAVIALLEAFLHEPVDRHALADRVTRGGLHIAGGARLLAGSIRQLAQDAQGSGIERFASKRQLDPSADLIACDWSRRCLFCSPCLINGARSLGRLGQLRQRAQTILCGLRRRRLTGHGPASGHAGVAQGVALEMRFGKVQKSLGVRRAQGERGLGSALSKIGCQASRDDLPDQDSGQGGENAG